MGMKGIICVFVSVISFLNIAANASQLPPPTQSPPSPWFTGPILAAAGHTIPAGHQNYEIYLFATDNLGFYNNQWKVVHQASTQTISPTLIFSQGLTHFMDLQFAIPYDFNFNKSQYASHLADSHVILGFQLLTDNPNNWEPDLRFTLKAAFPTGAYENLNPRKLATDATGAGLYQPGLGFNFQKLVLLANQHYLRTRFTLDFTIPLSTRVHNFSSYGGGFGTNGRINPGNKFAADLAFEYTLTQHWVPAIDIYYTYSGRTTFSGVLGTTLSGAMASVGRKAGDEYSLAPAIEYNFNSHIGLIIGTWFSLIGQNATDFASGVVALNIYY